MLKNVSMIFFILVAVMLSDRVLYAIERPELVFDERQWKVAEQETRGRTSIVKFILEKARYEDWREKVSVESMYGLEKRVDLEEYILQRQMKTKYVCPDTVWEKLDNQEGLSIYERISSHCEDGFDSYELLRVMVGEEAIHIVGYLMRQKAKRGKTVAKRTVTSRKKKKPFYEKSRRIWFENLKRVSLRK